MLHYTKLERLASDKHPSLLGPFMGYEKHVNIPQGLYNKVENIYVNALKKGTEKEKIKLSLSDKK